MPLASRTDASNHQDDPGNRKSAILMRVPAGPVRVAVTAMRMAVVSAVPVVAVPAAMVDAALATVA